MPHEKENNYNNNAFPPPLVDPDTRLTEITVKALILGVILSMTLAAANAYIGLLVGLTVSASIPAAAVSMGVLRCCRRTNILENNLVQTSASAGESLVAGMIFTIPALVMMGAWETYRYWPIVAIAIVGGILGVAFTIPLRKALIIEARLKFPEGVATAEVLKTGGIEHTRGQSGGDSASTAGFRMLIQATAIGGAFKLFESGFGLLPGNVAATAAWLKGKYLFMGNITLSPALIGVGYIVGFNIAMLVFAGGVIGTIIGVPLNWLFNSHALMVAVGIDPSTPWAALTTDDWNNLAGESWQNCRRIGVGAMMVGGLWSLISLCKPIVQGMKSSLSAYRAVSSGRGAELARTEFDTPINYVGWVVLLSVVPVFAIFYTVLGDYPDKLMIAVIMTALMLVFGFVFSSVAGYMSGLVGSSNNPISGVTIATVVVSALILLQLMGNTGLAATLGPIAVIYMAGLICSGAAIAGDNMQDLKCGHIVGATPWKQQIFQVVGVVSAAAVIPLILQILDAGQGIGRPIREGAVALSAPQAGLMRDLATGIFGAGINWKFIFMGFGLAVACIILDVIQARRGSSFRLPVLAVAVGIYLPLGLSVPIFTGGLLSLLVQRKSKPLSPELQQMRANSGLLLASGLITGEALMGVLIAGAAVYFQDRMPGEQPWAAYPGLLFTLAVIYYLYKRTLNSTAMADA